MSATIAAACACANTILFQSLRLQAFCGAVPHVVLVLDSQPCTQQKVLTEGYLRVIRAFNQHLPTSPQIPGEVYLSEKSNECGDHDALSLFIPLDMSARTPSGSLELNVPMPEHTACSTATRDTAPCHHISCSVVPFDAANFMDDMKQLQAFLRGCGEGGVRARVTQSVPTPPQTKAHASSASASDAANDVCEGQSASKQDTAPVQGSPNAEDEADITNTTAMGQSAFYEQYMRVRSYLQTLHPLPTSSRPTMPRGAEVRPDVDVMSRLWHGVRRELLGVILIQRSAFQNEMRRYRLRLSLFDMGMRVAEHCHLESMSTTADAAAQRGNTLAALSEDQVYSYARSCSLEPAVVQSFGQAIADAIDVQSWRRTERDGASSPTTNQASGMGAAADNNDTHHGHRNLCANNDTRTTNTNYDADFAAVSQSNTTANVPPVSFAAALSNDKIWELFQRGALQWGRDHSLDKNSALRSSNSHALRSPAVTTSNTTTTTTATEAPAAAESHTLHDVLTRPIVGPGAPLHIVCRDASKQLTYDGGMEDCLMNTGYYVAADSAARNDVMQHRARFPVSVVPSPCSSGHTQTCCTSTGIGCAAAAPSPSATCDVGTSPQDEARKSRPLEQVRGRLKKQDYLALRKEMKLKRHAELKDGHRASTCSSSGRSSNKVATRSACGVSDEDDEDGDVNQRPHMVAAAAGSCMHHSIGGTFPIGEVISESFDLSKLHGTCDVFAYPDALKNVSLCEPKAFTMTVEAGIVTEVSDNAPDDFMELLALVRQTEGACYVRELGIGLNPFVGMSHVLADVTSFERQWGVHLSLGQRHPLFVKQANKCNANGSVAEGVCVKGPVLKRKAGKYHIDIFVDAAALRMGELCVDFTRGIAVH